MAAWARIALPREPPGRRTGQYHRLMPDTSTFAPRTALALAPAALTLGNALAGFWAVLVLAGIAEAGSAHRLELACGLIAAAMACDALDGLAARATGTASAMGARLDALADAVSFGVAPALLAATTIAAAEPGEVGRRVGMAVAALYLAAAVLRLARFQVETPGRAAGSAAHGTFRGLPTPGAAAAVALAPVALPRLAPTWASAEAAAWAVGAAAGVAAVLMVGRCRYPHLVSRGLSRRVRFGHLAVLGAAAAGAAVWPVAAAALGVGVYAAWGPVGSALRRLRWRARRSPA